jgi:hypothetical protein
MRMRWWVALVVGLMLSVLAPAPAARAQVDIVGATEQKIAQEVDAKQAEKDARLAKLRAIQGRKQSRVLVLKWPDSDVTEENIILQAMVRNQIGRPGAKFYPSIDLYQEGRVRRYDHGIPTSPRSQTGRVPDELIEEARDELDRQRSRLGGGMNNIDVADALIPVVDEIWFNDRQETRDLLFDLYLTIGKSVAHLRDQTPPYYQQVGPENANYYLYLAAAMIWEEKQIGEGTLQERMPGGEIGELLQSLILRIEEGTHPTIPIAFHDQGVFDAEAFVNSYRLVINGVERVVDGQGYVMVPRGRIDVFMERDDGFSLSDRIEVRRLDDKLYFVVDVARQKMGYAILEALRNHPGECIGGISAETKKSLATYQALHPGDEIYVAIPWVGSPYNAYVWRWDPEDYELKLNVDKNKGFPVRFALFMNTGLFFNGASLNEDQLANIDTQLLDTAANGSAAGLPTQLAQSFLKLRPAGVPLDFQLRGHFNRLMFGFGVQFASNVDPQAAAGWADRYQVGPDNMVIRRPKIVDPDDPPEPVDPDADPFAEQLHELQWSRLIYGTLGVVLLKDATYGMGPRGFVRVGWYNLPHTLELSGHIGATTDPTFGKKEYKGRVVPLFDLDLFAGAMIPFGQTVLNTTVYKDPEDPDRGYKRVVLPNLGFTLGAGFSF